MHNIICNRITTLLASNDEQKFEKGVLLLSRPELCDDCNFLMHLLENTRKSKVVLAILNCMLKNADNKVIIDNIKLIHSRIVALLEPAIQRIDENRLGKIALDLSVADFNGTETLAFDDCIKNYQLLLENADGRIQQALSNFFLNYNGLNYVDVSNLLSYAISTEEFVKFSLVKASKTIDDVARRYFIDSVKFYILKDLHSQNVMPLWLESALDSYLFESSVSKIAKDDVLNMLSVCPFVYVKKYLKKLIEPRYQISRWKILEMQLKSRLRGQLHEWGQ